MIQVDIIPVKRTPSASSSTGALTFPDGSTTGTKADRATNAEYASEAGHAKTADHATNADHSAFADRAAEADHAASAANLDNDSTVWNEIKRLYLSKVDDDTAAGLITFLKGLTSNELATFLKGITIGSGGWGISEAGLAALAKVVTNEIVSSNYKEGLLEGLGFRYWKDDEGRAHIDTDYLTARIKAYFAELEIRKVTSTGGNIIFSNAGSRIESVKQVTASTTDGTITDGWTSGGVQGWKCYFTADDGTMETMNGWQVGDQAMCRTFNVKSGGKYNNVSNRYYWRLVVAVGEETQTLTSTDGTQTERTMGYVVLADTVNGGGLTATQLHDGTHVVKPLKSAQAFVLRDVSAGIVNDAPQAGDAIAQVGCQRGDGARRANAAQIVTNATGNEAVPSLNFYKNIIGFQLDPYKVLQLSPDGLKGTAKMMDITITNTAGEAVTLINYRGAWPEMGTEVANGDAFSYRGDVWAWMGGWQSLLTDAPSASNPNWQLASARGDKGDKGDPGAPGSKGDKGDTGRGITSTITLFNIGGARKSARFTLTGIPGSGTRGGGIKGRLSVNLINALTGERKTATAAYETGTLGGTTSANGSTVWATQWAGNTANPLKLTSTAKSITMGNNGDFHIQPGEHSDNSSSSSPTTAATFTLAATGDWMITGYTVQANSRSSDKPCTFRPLDGMITTTASGVETLTAAKTLSTMGGSTPKDTADVSLGDESRPGDPMSADNENRWSNDHTALVCADNRLATLFRCDVTTYSDGTKVYGAAQPYLPVADLAARTTLCISADDEQIVNHGPVEGDELQRADFIEQAAYTPEKGKYTYSCVESKWPTGSPVYSYSKVACTGYLGNDGESIQGDPGADALTLITNPAAVVWNQEGDVSVDTNGNTNDTTRWPDMSVKATVLEGGNDVSDLYSFGWTVAAGTRLTLNGDNTRTVTLRSPQSSQWTNGAISVTATRKSDNKALPAVDVPIILNALGTWKQRVVNDTMTAVSSKNYATADSVTKQISEVKQSSEELAVTVGRTMEGKNMWINGDFTDPVTDGGVGSWKHNAMNGEKETDAVVEQDYYNTGSRHNMINPPKGFTKMLAFTCAARLNGVFWNKDTQPHVTLTEQGDAMVAMTDTAYTLSFWARGMEAFDMEFGFEGLQVGTVHVTTSWQRFALVVPKGYSLAPWVGSIYFYPLKGLTAKSVGNFSAYITGIQLERGDTSTGAPTAWTRCTADDYQNLSSSITQTATQIKAEVRDEEQQAGVIITSGGVTVDGKKLTVNGDLDLKGNIILSTSRKEDQSFIPVDLATTKSVIVRGDGEFSPIVALPTLKAVTIGGAILPEFTENKNGLQLTVTNEHDLNFGGWRWSSLLNAGPLTDMSWQGDLLRKAVLITADPELFVFDGVAGHPCYPGKSQDDVISAYCESLIALQGMWAWGLLVLPGQTARLTATIQHYINPQNTTDVRRRLVWNVENATEFEPLVKDSTWSSYTGDQEETAAPTAETTYNMDGANWDGTTTGATSTHSWKCLFGAKALSWAFNGWNLAQGRSNAGQDAFPLQVDVYTQDTPRAKFINLKTTTS